jgi:PPK2 family polyphosphate:nucleotide phosphotransferase
MRPDEYVKRFRVGDGSKFRLRDFDAADCADLDINKKEAKDLLQADVKALSDWQERFYAHDRWSLLLIFQAMDAAGKDGAIKHVMSGVNPQGCMVTSFKVPSEKELDHDFLWRTTVALPERGRIGVFNRSYYEEVLVVRVHPKILDGQKLPSGLVTNRIWQERFESIRDLERHMTRNGTVILKFFLNISREEQRKRFLSRIDEQAKNWKFSMGDVRERALWDRYMEAYEDMIRHTATPEAPWHVVPADKKWFTRLIVARTIVDKLEKLNPQFPRLEASALEELANAREALIAEGPPGNGKPK